MGWFNSQIEERRNADRETLEDSFARIAGVVMGQRMAQKLDDESIVTKNALDEILKYYHCKTPDIPESITDMDEQIDYCLRAHGFMRREVELGDKWYRDAYGPVLAFTTDGGEPVAMIPGSVSGYSFKSPETGKTERVSAKNADLFGTEAVCFYRPLPQKKLGIPDLLLYMEQCISVSDIAMIAAATLAATLIGMMMPRVIKALTGPVNASGRADALIAVAICIVCVTTSSQLMDSVKALATARLSTKTTLSVQAAMMMRLMSLPAGFFRKYTPGELNNRSRAVSNLCAMMMDLVMSTGLTSLMSLLYITQIFRFAPSLVIPSIIIVVITVAFSSIATLIQIRVNRRLMDKSAVEAGIAYSLITGVQKIKLAGAEKRLFSKWLNSYTEVAELQYDPPVFIKISEVISTGITLFSNIVLYYVAAKSGIGQSDYFAFMSAYNMLMGAFMAVSDLALSAAQIQPTLEMAEPFLKGEPETTEGKEIVTQISGGLEMDHVSFRYDEESPYILDDLSLKIRPGEYVAVVGKTGCGKSTLMRLLLGFERPEKGAVFFDGKDIESLDKGSLRKKIGTVMQDAGLFQGDIYSNIVITAPELTLNDAWEAAETAGIADDIREMPMGMHTVIAEGAGGISGGQRQRIMIARAIAPKPKLLLFDEATSALDNKTQRQVSEALDGMGCTRLVIAHRLSTIKHCDRILVLEGGRIVEDGTYDELLKMNGRFAELVERQRLDTKEA